MRSMAVVLMLMVLALTNIHAQEAEPPPYLYYYSQLLGGLIIERADGTDSRQIAADIIPAGMSGLMGPGWSPSGKYFAAYRFNYDMYKSTTGETYLINQQGKSVFNFLGVMPYPALMQWSPRGEDILLVVSDMNMGMFFWLIDAERGVLLADFSARLENFNDDMSDIIWDVANQQIVFYISMFLYESDRVYRVTLHFDGTTLREPVEDDEFRSRSETIVYEDFETLRAGYGTSPSRRYEVRGLFPSVLTDTMTGSSVTLPRHTRGTVCRAYQWNSDEEYIISLSGMVVAGGGCGEVDLGITDSKGEMWREIGGCSWASPPCVGWLPESIDVSSFPPGLSESVQLDYRAIIYEEDAVYGLSREPHLRFICEDEITAKIIDLVTQKTLYQLSGISCPYIMSERAEGIEVIAAYDPVHDLLATYTDLSADVGVTIWIKQNDRYEPALKLNTNGYQLEFTDEGQSLRARNTNGWKIYAVMDILRTIEAKE